MSTHDYELASAVADMTASEWREWSAAQDARTTTPPGPDREPDPEQPAPALACSDAVRTTTAMYAAGVSLDVIKAHHQDVAAQLRADAKTPSGLAYAREYTSWALTFLADLERDEAEAGPAPEPGTPHPDPDVAARGWVTEPGGTRVYVCQRSADLDAEAA